MAQSQKARYLVSGLFIELGATAVCRLSIREEKFVTITTTIWSAIDRMLHESDEFLAEVSSGYKRDEYAGNLAIHLHGNMVETQSLRSMTRRLDKILMVRAMHFDAIVVSLVGAGHDSLA